MNSELRFDLVTDLEECEKLWREFSEDRTIFDAWEFRALFQKYHQKEVRFYAVYKGVELVGLLPLQCNQEAGYIEFFGGSYMEDNRLFTKSGFEHVVPKFYEYLSGLGEKIKLEYMAETDPHTTTLPIQDYKYILPLEGINNYEDFLEKYFSKKSIQTFRRKVKKIDELGVEIIKNNYEDFDLFVKYHDEMFGDHSSFVCRPFHEEIMRDLFSLQAQKPLEPFLLTFKVNGVIEAVSYYVMYNGTYVNINAGIRPEAPENMSTFVNLHHINFAVQAKAHKMDHAAGAYGWKDRWHFTPEPQHQFSQNM